MNIQRTIAALTLLVLLPFLAAAQDAGQVRFNFWFQRDGGCAACAKMPPPATGTFPQMAGIDVMFNGFDQATGGHWQNQSVQGYAVTYTYQLNGMTYSAKQTAPGDAASVVIKPYAVSDLNAAQIVSISVTAAYATGTVTKTENSPVAFQVY
jgi:hypothetical protein